MTLDADALVDRRRTRRKLNFWRATAFVIAAAGVLAAGYLFGWGDGVGSLTRPHIARITIDGVIVDDRELAKMIREIGDDSSVRAVIVSIDSPGGTTTGGESLYIALRDMAGKKPTVATVRTLAASAGYMAAIAADRIVAQRTSITGSIGVLFQYPNVVPLMDKIGVTVETVKSAPLKAEPSPFTRGEVPGSREVLARLVDDTYQWFVDIVAERRGLPRSEALRLADGSIYSGRQALEAKLIDAIGDEEDAIAWLEAERNVGADLPVLDRRPPRESGPFDLTGAMLDLAASLTGYDLRVLRGPRALDGLVSVWHPQLSDTQ